MSEEDRRRKSQDADQAGQLRELAGKNAAPSAQLPALAITGGKGGVGKTCLAVNLSLALVEQGLKPLLIDIDMGLANADVLLNLNPATTLYHVMMENKPAASAILKLQSGLSFLPAASGREELTRLGAQQLQRLVKDLVRISEAYDLLVFDTAAGIGPEVLTFLGASRTILAVITPDPTSVTDAYALIKIIEQRAPGKDIRIVVNQAANPEEAAATFARIRKVAQAYLQRDLTYAGMIPRDRAVADAVRKRQPFAQVDGPASQALRSLAVKLKAERWKD